MATPERFSDEQIVEMFYDGELVHKPVTSGCGWLLVVGLLAGFILFPSCQQSLIEYERHLKKKAWVEEVNREAAEKFKELPLGVDF